MSTPTVAPTIKVADTPEAIAAAHSYAERTGHCVQSAFDAAGIPVYCHCPGCVEYAQAMQEQETYAENAWLRASEIGDPCRGAWTLDGGCACC